MDGDLLVAAKDEEKKIEVKNVGEQKGEIGEEVTIADEVAKKHLKWLKEKQSKKDQGGGEHVTKSRSCTNSRFGGGVW